MSPKADLKGRSPASETAFADTDGSSLNVAVNGRTFHVDEPEGAIGAGLTLCQFLGQHGDVEVTVFGSRKMNLPDSVKRGKSMYPTPTPFFAYGLIWERTILPRLARRNDADVLFCPNGNGPLHDPGYPTVMLIHDVSAQLGMSSGIHGFYRQKTVPRAARVATRIATVSEFSKREISDNLPVPPSKIDVVPNGVDGLFLSEDPGDEFGLPDDFVLFAGGLNPRKNVSRLVEAFRSAKRDQDFPHKLVFVGPPNRFIFEDLEFESSDEVIHKGFVTKRELKYAYGQADLFAYPSLYEGFGMPPLEAMASGTAALASERPPFTETIGEQNAKLVDPENTNAIARGIVQVLTNDSYRRELAERGQQRAQAFTWERSKQNLVSSLKRAVHEYDS